MVETIEWTDAGVVMIDQTRLPREQVFVTCRSYVEVAEAIRSMVIRGAPAIGVAAAMGVALGVQEGADFDTRVRNAGQHASDGGEFVLGHRADAGLRASLKDVPREKLVARMIEEAKQHPAGRYRHLPGDRASMARRWCPTGKPS